MGQGKFLPSGVVNTDALNVQNAKLTQYYDATVMISGITEPVVKKIPHMLGKVPQSWSVKRASPTDVVDGQGVTEAVDGAWDNNGVELMFLGNGTWTVRFQ